MAPKISVCLTIRNGEKFLKQQVESILPQLNSDDEIICSDDHSTDHSLNIIESFNDSRIKITKPSTRNNYIRNFEHALNLCSGDYIFLSDHDDVWMNDKVGLMAQNLLRYDLVLSDCVLIDELDNEIAPSLFKIQKTKSGLIRNYLKNSYTGCCIAFHRKVLTKALPFPNSIVAHDQWIGLVAEKYFSVCLLPKPLVQHRKHKHNTSSTGEKSKLSWLDQLNYRFVLLRSLSVR